MSNYSAEVNALLHEASKLYASRKFDLASQKYGDVCELYSNENEGNENIELLLLYGKSLFQSGVSKSEAFGGAESTETQQQPQNETEDDLPVESANFQFNETLAEEEEEEDEDHKTPSVGSGSNTGDISRDESDPEEEEEEEEEEEAKNQTDFEILWDILDLTRALIEEKLSEFKEEDKPTSFPLIKDEKLEKQTYVDYLEKLSETYDLLGEVSLELENFTLAATDLAKSLELRQQLYRLNSQAISESHYKLSLALEFCVEDPESRSKAAEQMKLALEIVKSQPDKDEELIKDLEVRLVDLNKDPAEELQAEKEKIIKGILGEKVDDEDGGKTTQTINDSGAQPVNDLTSMIVKKKRKSDNKKIPGQKKQKQ